ncbi:MAG: RDD family protein [Acidobacteriota bacterium]
MAEQMESTKPEIPAWRKELNEKIQAIKAKRELESLNSGETQNGLPVNNGSPTTQAKNTSFIPNQTTKSELPKPKIVNPVVEKALRRYRIANENAIRASIPRIESARTSQAAASLALDKEATARKLEHPVPEEKSYVQPQVELEMSEVVPISEPRTQQVTTPSVIKRLMVEEDEFAGDGFQGKSDPLDYIYAEVGKSGETPKSITAKLVDHFTNEPQNIVAATDIPNLSTHLKIFAIDLLTIALSAAPFFLVIKAMGGEFNHATSIVTGIGLIGFITTFYLLLSQTLCGKTFGMMISNTHIVDVGTDRIPSFFHIILRTIGYFISFTIALAGFFWVAIDPQHRGWYDLISHTVVVRDK